ncbi:cupin domain-containing protein [uncultured Thiothrix sp.]|uniref:cupin domain-containing protein n=1 Tax=uncultured Thiothrix sp. TaxID=223185 RepID=UPI002630F115|nr:cupin domain-containing protein [uncultured Thiothrix sp.]
MQPLIISANPHNEYYFHEGCHILELSNSPADSEISIARARVEAGQTTQWHWLLHTTERYVILAGSGVVEIGALEPQAVQTGDVVLIPPHCRQRIRNTGDTDLIFLAICSPRFRAENYCSN